MLALSSVCLVISMIVLIVGSIICFRGDAGFYHPKRQAALPYVGALFSVWQLLAVLFVLCLGCYFVGMVSRDRAEVVWIGK
jgi:hypothetical protein